MMEPERNDRGSPDGGHSASAFSISISQDSALPTTTTLPTTEPDDDDDDDDRTEVLTSHTPSRSKSSDPRRMTQSIRSSPQTLPVTGSSSADRFKHSIRYLTDGFIRKVTKQNTISRINTLNLSHLRDKKIRYIENLQSLTNLEVLDLSNNLIERIDGLKTLKKLKQLLLANNFIRTMTNLEELSRLELLDLHQNQISEIPVWFGKRLTSLRTLNLAQNQISSFDQIARLRTLYELRQVHLRGNPIDQHEHYRLLVISYVPSLEQLDGINVTEAERKQAKEQFIQQEVQNLLHELERRDHECRRLNNQATSNVQQLEITSDKLQSLENKSSVQAKEIEELRERLAMSEALLQRKTSLLHQACEKQCQLEQELAFYKIDLKFDRFNHAKTADQTTVKGASLLNPSILKLTPEQIDDNGEMKSPSKMQSIPWSKTDVQRILGAAPDDKFHQTEDESIYNEKLLELAINVSELTFLQAKQRVIENRLQHATDEHLSHAVIEHLSDDLNQVQTELMDKISDVQELKLVLHGLRRDNGQYLANDLEQVTIELKLDEIVREHILQMKEPSNQSTGGAPTSIDEDLTELQATVANQREQLRAKELNEQVTQHQILDLQLALERQQIEGRERIQQIEEMAEREKQRILKHLEDEKRFTRDIIEKSETMIEQLKRELSAERQRKTEEQKAQESLRDIYKKINPNLLKETMKKDENDEDESQSDGETTVYHKDDPLLASTPRDRSLLMHRHETSDLTFLQHQLDESNSRRESRRSSLPPTPKRKLNKNLSNGASLSVEKTPTKKKTFLATNQSLSDRQDDEEDDDLLYRLHGFVKKGQLYMSNLGDLARTTVNDSGYSSQQTGREAQLDNPKLQPLLSSQPFTTFDKTTMDPTIFNRDYTVGIVSMNNGASHPRYPESSDVKNVTLYPTPEGYVLGPYSVTVPSNAAPPPPANYTNLSPSHSINHTESQYFACVTIPPDGLSSNRPIRDHPREVTLQGPVVFRQDTILSPEKVSPVTVKLRSLKFPQSDQSTMTDGEGIPRSIDRIQDEIDYLKTKLHQQGEQVRNDNQYHLFKDLLETQTRELHQVRSQYQEMINGGRETENARHELFNQLQRIRRNVHEHLSPNLLRFVDQGNTPATPAAPSNLIPLNHDEHWICTVPRHSELEQVISDLQHQLEDYRRELATMKQENRRLERSLMKQSIKIDALDLAASTKRAKTAAEAENLQDDLYILEQQLIRKQRELVVAQDQLKQMTSLSQQVIADLKTARHRHTLTKRETKAFELKIAALTEKLYKVTRETKDAEEIYTKVTKEIQTLDQERVKLDQIVDEKRALNIVLDEQLRSSFQSFNSLLNSSLKCLQELTSAVSPIEEEFRFHSLPPSPIQISQLSSSLPSEELQRQVSHIVSENNRLLARYHSILQQQRQKFNALQNEISEKETELSKVKGNLEAYNEQLKKNAEELLQDKTVLEELERIKEMKSDKLAEIERLIDRRQAQERHAQQELEQLNNEQQRLKKQMKDALAEHEQLKHNIDADRQVFNEMKNESTRLREQIKSFLDDKETLDETCDLLAKKCEALHNECKEKENNLPLLIAQIDEKLTVCKNLEEDIKKLKLDKTRCLEEVTEMKEKIERKRLELAQSPNSFELEQQNDELKHRIRRQELDFERVNREIDERNRTLNELNTMIAYAKSIMKNVQPTENRQNYSPPIVPVVDQRQQQENHIYYETKIHRLTKALDEKERELRAANLQLITTKDELQQLQQKVHNQESNADAIRNSMQIELDKLRHWLQIYENRKAMLRPQYHETLKELELKLHEQEMFYRKQIQELDSEMKKKYHSKASDDSGFLSDTNLADHRFSPSVDTHDTSFLREQIQTIFTQHAQELDKYNSKYKTNLSNLKNRLHELENSTHNSN